MVLDSGLVPAVEPFDDNVLYWRNTWKSIENWEWFLLYGLARWMANSWVTHHEHILMQLN